MKKNAMFLLCSGVMILGLSTSIWRLVNPAPASANMGVQCNLTSCYNGTPGGSNLYCPKTCSCGGVYCQ